MQKTEVASTWSWSIMEILHVNCTVVINRINFSLVALLDWVESSLHNWSKTTGELMVTVHVSYWARLPAHCLSSFLLEVHFGNTTTDDQNWSLQPWCRQIWLIWVVRLATPHQVLGPLELCRVLGCKWSPYRTTARSWRWIGVSKKKKFS